MLVDANSKAFPLSEDALRKWAKREGIFLHPEAAFLVKTQTMGMGVFAKKGIGKGQTVISCPHTAYIAPMDETVNNAPAAAAIHNYKFNAAALLAAANAEMAGTEKKAEGTTTTEDRLDDWTRTVLRLMAEVLRADSPWRSWLQCCPRMPDSLFDVPLPSQVTGITTSGADAEATTATPAADVKKEKVAKQQEVLFGLPSFLKTAGASCSSTAIISGPAQQLQDLSIEKKWLLVKPLLDAHPHIWPANIPAHCNAPPLSAAAQQAAARAAAARPASAAGAPAPTAPAQPPKITSLRDLFMECAAQVTSRNFHRESQDRPGPYLLPTIDFLNHSAERKNVDFQIHGGGGGKRHVTFDVIATRDILPKEQIFHDYGALSAARFLVEFQFVLHAKALQGDEGLRWSKEALSTLVSLLYVNGNAANNSANALTFAQKYQTCMNRCSYLIKNDLFLFEEGVIMSGGLNEGVGGGDGGNNGGDSGAVDLKAANVIDYASGRAVVNGAPNRANGLDAWGSGQQSRSAAVRRAERKVLEVQYLHNALFLLSVSDVCFEGLKPFLSRHWTVMDIAANRREYEATGAGQRVITELGCPLSSAVTAAALAAATGTAATATPAGISTSAAAASATNAEALPADSPYGAFGTTAFRVGPTVLKEVSTNKLATIVAETLTKPFIKAYEQVLEYQLTTMGEAAAAAGSVFATPRTTDMVQQVLTHELGLTRTLATLAMASAQPEETE